MPYNYVTYYSKIKLLKPFKTGLLLRRHMFGPKESILMYVGHPNFTKNLRPLTFSNISTCIVYLTGSIKLD